MSQFGTLLRSTIEIPSGAQISIIPIGRTDGYDGHSLRAYAYFKHLMPDIEDTVESINSIADRYPKQRQDSKAPTFALTYLGTWRTLMVNCGFTEEVAKAIEANFHKLYEQSGKWVADKLDQASIDGYVTLAFGLRLRTPMLKKSVLGSKYTPSQVAAESRTAGNAVSGQSYGLLNSRAGVDFQNRCMASVERLNVRPCAAIHDANYAIIRNNLKTVEWVNRELGDCVKWQELPEIWHEEVKLFGELDVFYPTWADGITLNNGASIKEIHSTIKEKISARTEK